MTSRAFWSSSVATKTHVIESLNATIVETNSGYFDIPEFGVYATTLEAAIVMIIAHRQGRADFLPAVNKLLFD